MTTKFLAVVACVVATLLPLTLSSTRADVLSYYIKGGAAEFGIVDFSTGTSTAPVPLAAV